MDRPTDRIAVYPVRFPGCKGRDGRTRRDRQTDRQRGREAGNFCTSFSSLFPSSLLPPFFVESLPQPENEQTFLLVDYRPFLPPSPSLSLSLSIFSNNSALNHFFYAPPSLPSRSVHSNRSGGGDGGDDNSAVVKFQGCGIGRQARARR